MLLVYFIPLGAGKFSQWFLTACQHSQTYFIKRSIQFLFVCSGTELKLSCRCFSGTSTLWQLQIQDHTPFLSHAFLGQAGIIVVIQLSSLLSHVDFPVVGVMWNFHFLFSPWWTVHVHSYTAWVNSTHTPFPVTPRSCSDVGLYP